MLLARHGRALCRDRNIIHHHQGRALQLMACGGLTRQAAATMSSSTAEASTSYQQRVLGSVLGAMCGDALGASVEGWSAERIQSAFPGGLRTFQHSERG
jgi:hypothetical protein